MRGAGCTYNDIVDRDLDAKVARTADRPLAAGTVSLKAAWIFLIAQSLVGFLVLIRLAVTRTELTEMLSLVVYGMALIGLAHVNAGDTFGFGRRWKESPVVQDYPILR